MLLPYLLMTYAGQCINTERLHCIAAIQDGEFITEVCILQEIPLQSSTTTSVRGSYLRRLSKCVSPRWYMICILHMYVIVHINYHGTDRVVQLI